MGRQDLKLVPASPPGTPARLEELADQELMVLAGGGSQEAFAVLVARHMEKVVRYCAKATLDRRAGEELAQETFLRIWAHRGRYRPGHSFTAFLFMVACNLCRNYRRWWRRRGRHETSEVALDFGAIAGPGSPIDDLLDNERRRRVHLAVGRLAPKLREAILLRFDQGLDYAEMARIVGSPEVTVRSRVFLGVKKLRALLEEDIA